MGNLGATLDQIAWVVTGYVVANVIVIPMTGWFASTFGRRNYFTRLADPVHRRVVLLRPRDRPVGAGDLPLHPGSRRRRHALDLAGDPGGNLSTRRAGDGQRPLRPRRRGGAHRRPHARRWITDSYSWRWIFYVNLPIGILAALMAMAFIPESGDVRQVSKKVDWTGIGLLVAGIGSLQIVLERGESEDWFATNYIIVLTVVAVLSLAAFIWRELTIDYPIVDLKVLKDRSLAVGTFFTFIMGFGPLCLGVHLPRLRPEPARLHGHADGLILLPGSLATAVMMPVVGKLMQKGVPPQLMNALGFISFFFFTWMLAHSTLASDRLDFFWPLILRGVGHGVPVRAADHSGPLEPARPGHCPGRGADQHDAPARRLLRRGAGGHFRSVPAPGPTGSTSSRTRRSMTPPCASGSPRSLKD